MKKQLLSLLLALVLMLSMVPAVYADSGLPNVTRLAGKDRIQTAFQVADQLKKELAVEKFDNMIVASGATFADALPGSYLSAVKNAPILLTLAKQKYIDQTADYIKANLKDGGTVYILGGESAVPPLMEQALPGLNVKRVAGKDRFGTNLEILKEAGVKPGSEILVCTAKEFADSLSAAATGKPILLVYKKITNEQKAYLATLSGNSFCVVGGTSAVPETISGELEKYGSVSRLAGKNRMDTSVLVAKTFFPDAQLAVVAYGWDFPDGLCGGSLAYATKSPLILTIATKEETAAKYVAESGITGGYALGGTVVLPEETVRKIFPVIEVPEPTECAHKYDNACDKDCNLCGTVRTPAEHVYDNACDKDCNLCGAVRTPAEHVYDDAYDGDCNVCGMTRTPAVKPLQITLQPQDALIPSGGAEHAFTVAVSGGTEPYSYQWQYMSSLVADFTDIDEMTRAFCSGFHTASMELELYPTDFTRGTRFRCVITDAKGEKVISNIAKVTEYIPPLKISNQPTDVTARIGDNAVFTVVAEGGKGSFTYQWQYMSNMQPNWLDITDDHGGLLSGYQTADLRLNVISDHYNDCYMFRCVVTDSRGESVTSDVAAVYEYVPVTIYSQPKDVYASEGCYYEIPVTVGSGMPTYTYQWYWKMDGVSNAIPFDGTEGWGAENFKTDTLGLIAKDEMFENNFYVFCKISDQSGDEVESNRAYVVKFFGLLRHTGSRGVDIGAVENLEVEVFGGKAPYSYQLQRRFGSNGTFQNYGAAKSSYEKTCTVKEEMKPEILEMLPEYRYVITDANGKKLETDPFGFWEYKQITFISQPQNAQNVDVGDEVTFTVEVDGSDKPFVYQWYSHQANGYVVFEKIEGATDASYTHTFTETDRKYNLELYCQVTDGRGHNIYSDTIRPTYSLWIKSQSKTSWDLSVTDTPTFVVTPAGGSGSYTYEWEIYFDQNKKWSPIQDKYSWIDETTTNTHAMKILKLQDWYECYEFRCKVSDGTDSVYSESISIDVN